MKDSPPNDQGHWKNKYYDLLAELEDNRAHQQVSELELCKLTRRLVTGLSGLDPALDPHLREIRNLLNSGLKDDEARAQLTELSDRLLRCDYTSTGTPAAKAESTPDSRRSRIAPIDEASIGPDRIRTAILDLLNEFSVPEKYVTAYRKLCTQLHTEEDTDRFCSLVRKTSGLLTDARESMLNEQHELEEFLTQLMNELADLGKQAINANLAQKASSAGRSSRENTIYSHFDELRAKTHTATDLAELKGLIRDHLDLITSQISSNSDVETRRQAETEARLSELTDRVQQMELEASDLRSKLRMEHNKALRDQLTGLPNRLAYEERIAQEVPRWMRFHQPLTLLVWDIDLFKSINDRFGHAAGDKVLKAVGEDLARGLRQTDFVCRYGGEEFVMLLPGATTDAAFKVAESIRTRVSERRFHSKEKRIEVSISCGLMTFSEGDTAEQVFECADKALYRAKEQGRNQCVVGCTAAESD